MGIGHWACLDISLISREPETRGEQERAHPDGDFSVAQVNVTLSVSPRWAEADNNPEEREAEHKGWLLSLLPRDWVWCRLRFPAENRNRQPWHGPEDFWKSGDFSPNEGEFLPHCLWNSLLHSCNSTSKKFSKPIISSGESCKISIIFQFKWS